MPRPALLLALPSLLLLEGNARAEILERVVAKVNGDIVTLSDFQTRQVAAAQAAHVAADKIEVFLRQTNARILQEAIDELLLAQRAGELGMKMRPEMIKDIIEGIKKENNLETDGELQEQLRREGMSMDDLKRSIERASLKREVLRREIESKVAVSEEEAFAQYQARRASDFTKPATVKLEEIVVKGEAPDKANAIVSRARSGEDFATLARTYSEAPTASSGGTLGTLAQGEMNPELERVVFALAPGAISEPIPQADGYRIIRLVEKTEGSVVPYERAKTEIRRQLGEAKMQTVYDAYLAGLRQKAILDIRVREVPLTLSGTVPDDVLLEAPLLGGRSGELAAPAGPESAAAPPGRAAPRADDAEIATTPQAAPERVAPPPPPGAPDAKTPAPKKDEAKKPEKPPGP